MTIHEVGRTWPRERPPRVLCVDDEAVTLRLICRLLERAGLQPVAAASPEEALRLFDAGGIDLVITDVRMPGMDGLRFLQVIRERDPQVPAVVATGFATLETAIQALREGALGMIIKPFTASEFLDEVQAALEAARVRRDALQYRFVTPILDGLAVALGAAIEARHLETGAHCREIGLLSETVAGLIGVDEQERTRIRLGGYLHDIGKIAIADAILLKPGPLTPDETVEMPRHAEIGASILETHEAMVGIAGIVRHHHEQWDGSGYPTGLAGTDIPLGARIVAVADAYNAMVTDRIYRPATSEVKAFAELERCVGRQFDPAVVRVFPRALAIVTPLLAAGRPTERESIGA